MPVLMVPPPVFISESPEIAARLKKEAETFVKEQLQFFPEAQLKETVQQGKFKGTQVFQWPNNYNGILQTSFLLPTGKVQEKDFVRISSLIRAEDCVHMGSVWKVTSPLAGLSLSSSQVSLSEIAKRNFRPVSPLRFNTHITGIFGTRGMLIFDAHLAEGFSARGYPVDTSESRLACAWSLQKDSATQPVPNSNSKYPARAHRILNTQISFSPVNLQVNGGIVMTGGVFGEKNSFVETFKNSSFAPQETFEKVFPAIQKTIHDMKQESFKITKREGRWAYLERGKAYGLTIGSHLVGPAGSELHVIQYAPGALKDEPDVAVALIRKESEAAPLKPGDALTFDLQKFPK